jgi:hypothetical protein
MNYCDERMDLLYSLIVAHHQKREESLLHKVTRIILPFIPAQSNSTAMNNARDQLHTVLLWITIGRNRPKLVVEGFIPQDIAKLMRGLWRRITVDGLNHRVLISDCFAHESSTVDGHLRLFTQLLKCIGPLRLHELDITIPWMKGQSLSFDALDFNGLSGLQVNLDARAIQDFLTTVCLPLSLTWITFGVSMESYKEDLPDNIELYFEQMFGWIIPFIVSILGCQSYSFNFKEPPLCLRLPNHSILASCNKELSLWLSHQHHNYNHAEWEQEDWLAQERMANAMATGNYIEID